MYTLFLILHSWLRWGALIAGLLAIFMLVTTRPKAGEANPADRWGLFFLIALDLQLVVGMLLYWVFSPNMAAIRENFGEAMRTQVTRFWAVEHVALMVVAVIALHVGRVVARKAGNPDTRRKRLLIGMSIALLAMIAGTPWPGRPYGRPMIRMSAQP